MNLIYMCVFHQHSYIDLLRLLIRSIYIHSNIDRDTTDILIITSPEFESSIQDTLAKFPLPIKYYILPDIHTLFEAGCARLNIFKYEHIHKYNKILYLDTDILINSDIRILFNIDISSDKLYALEEGLISDIYHGSQFFDLTKFVHQTTAFTSGILFFTNSPSMKYLFDTIQAHIVKYIYVEKNTIPVCLDQPFIVYNAMMQNKSDNQLLKTYAENRPHCVDPIKIIYHFPDNIGHYETKAWKMNHFWGKISATPLENKRYSWQNHSILFLKDGGMDAFGSGNYSQEDKYIFQAKFGHRIHTLVFNEDYTQFTSTRHGDNLIVIGNLLT